MKIKIQEIMGRDKQTKDLMNLVHDVVGATLSMKAGIENIQHRYSDNKDMMKKMERMEANVKRVDKALDSYYVAVKGEPRN